MMHNLKEPHLFTYGAYRQLLATAYRNIELIADFDMRELAFTKQMPNRSCCVAKLEGKGSQNVVC
jgi:hypothetical protein